MTMSDYISLAALAISVLSFTTSAYFGLLDRVRIRAVSKVYNADSGFGPAYIEVKVVNCGRRVAILTMFGGKLDNGSWIGTHIGESGKGIRLAENEYHVETINSADLQQYDPSDGDFREYEDFWFEDSLGRRHAVKHSRREIAKLKNASNNAAELAARKMAKPQGKC